MSTTCFWYSQSFCHNTLLVRWHSQIWILPNASCCHQLCWSGLVWSGLVWSGNLMLAFTSNHSWLQAPQDSWLYFSDWLPNCWWPSPAQSFLVPSSTGLMTMSYCLTAPGALRPALAGQARSCKLLLVLSSRVILGSELYGTHDQTLLSHDYGSHATLAGSGMLLYIGLLWTDLKMPLDCCACICCCRNVF
jgi:hypothetical protein